MKVIDFRNVCQEQKNLLTEFINNMNIGTQLTRENNPCLLVISDEDAEKIESEEKFDWFDHTIRDIEYDVVFNDSENSNEKGFRTTFWACVEYIKQYNGTDESYFADYKGETVSVFCCDIEQQDRIYSETVR